MTFDEANELVKDNPMIKPGLETSDQHFAKALHFDTMHKNGDTEAKRNMAAKAVDRHLNIAAALETLGK